MGCLRSAHGQQRGLHKRRGGAGDAVSLRELIGTVPRAGAQRFTRSVDDMPRGFS